MRKCNEMQTEIVAQVMVKIFEKFGSHLQI